MLNENIKAIRKSKGLSQEELAVKLNVVRQTISKWENGLSVPDSDMLISISEALETPVSVLLGEPVAEPETDDLKAICEKLEIINLQLARRKTARRTIIHWLVLSLCAVLVIRSGVAGAAFHAFEWLFVRAAPVILIGAAAGAFLTRKKA